MEDNKLRRFHQAQEGTFDKALSELKNGRKTSHWMWFIFPQMVGLGSSEASRRYAINSLTEAEQYLADGLLGGRLVQISRTSLELEGKSANDIFGSPDDLKLRSSMTLFAAVKDADPVFQQVLDKYFGGKGDSRTLEILERKKQQVEQGDR